jgi:hypothetical protein
MEIKELESKWSLLKPESTAGYKSIRISSDCIPDLFVGVDSKDGRCLILKLPINHNVDFKSIIKQNLSIELFIDTRWIVLRLLNLTFVDLFNELILSLYNKIKGIGEIKQYSSELLQSFYKWSEFFDEQPFDRLSEENIKGLFGEVLVLNQLLEESSSSYVNDILNSWKGPFDSGHDFVLNDKNLEVKTKDHLNIDVRISSEYQLKSEQQKELQLVVIDIISDNSGLSLNDLFQTSRKLIIEKYGDLTILIKTINRKGLNFQNLLEYSHYKYVPKSITYYSCMNPAFPKIINGEISDLISNVKYNIRINSLDSFIINQKYF